MLETQEDASVFDHFDENIACTVGSAIRDTALKRRAAVAIEIRDASRCTTWTPP